jgi:2-keto-4-pentenoate hydratase/2-oxohepta-3-ene-1,7-dioic acid hydratase in catechol pathway
MRIARFELEGTIHAGIVVDGDRAVVPLHALGERPDTTVLDVLQLSRESRETLVGRAETSDALVPLAVVHLLAPIPRPPKFIGVGMNSPSHAAELDEAPETPEIAAARALWGHLALAYPNPHFPLMFNKQTSCVSGPHDPIWHPHDAAQVDYEGEVVLVIGRRARRLDESEAVGAIAGFMVTNDVSVREWQNDTSQMWLGKSFETHGPTGPWVVTADDVEQSDFVIRTWVNDELRQEGRLADQTASPAQIVSRISQVCTLEPGDLIATGTPGGVGAASGRYLEVGDVVRVDVSGLGEIENAVVAEPDPAQTALVRGVLETA